MAIAAVDAEVRQQLSIVQTWTAAWTARLDVASLTRKVCSL